jgi:hypothetical protein
MPISLKKMKATHWFLGAAFDTATRTGTVLLDGHQYTFKETAENGNRFLRSVESAVMPAAAVPQSGMVRLAEPVRVVFKHYEDRVRKILEVVNPEIDLPIVRVGTQQSADGMHTEFVFEYDPSCLPDTVRVAGQEGQGTGPSVVPADPAQSDDGLPADDPEEA